jgi:hypothetical protein
VDSDLGLDFIKKLSPKKWNWKWGKRPHYGILSQDVGEILEDIGQDFAGFIKSNNALVEKVDGDIEWMPIEKTPKDSLRTIEEKTVYHLRYQEFIGPIIKSIQEFYEEFQQFKKEK